MKTGYIRLGDTCPALEAQRSALRMLGLGDGALYVEEAAGGKGRSAFPAAGGKAPVLPRREAALDSLGEGDEFLVAEEGIVGLNDVDTLGVLARLAARGATLVVAASGERHRWHPDAARALDLAREAESQRRRWRAANARGSARPRPKLLQGEDEAGARADWGDPSLSGEQVAAKWGVSHRTLYYAFGARGGAGAAPLARAAEPPARRPRAALRPISQAPKDAVPVLARVGGRPLVLAHDLGDAAGGREWHVPGLSARFAASEVEGWVPVPQGHLRPISEAPRDGTPVVARVLRRGLPMVLAYDAANPKGNEWRVPGLDAWFDAGVIGGWTRVPEAVA